MNWLIVRNEQGYKSLFILNLDFAFSDRSLAHIKQALSQLLQKISLFWNDLLNQKYILRYFSTYLVAI